MKVKTSIRLLNKLYGVGNVELRTLLSDQLSTEEITKVTNKYPTLDAIAEVKRDEIKVILNVTDDVVNIIKKAAEEFFNSIDRYDVITGMPDEISPAERVQWGKLIEASQTYGTDISTLKAAINKLSTPKEREYLKLKFGLKDYCCDSSDGCHKEYSDAEISEKLDIPVSEIDEYGVKVLNSFTNCILETR